jgi:hypothetical protein
MVRALLDGRKTQTRRILKATEDGFEAPKIQRGDRLWVRENWRVGAWDIKPGGGIAVDYIADSHARKEWLGGSGIPDEQFSRLVKQSQADASKAGRPTDFANQFCWKVGESPCRQRPSIHMPRWASRLTLEVTDVRVERLQDITDAGALAEGIEAVKNPFEGYRDYLNPEMDEGIAPRHSFQTLWDSINGPDAWYQNPWLAAYTFTVHRNNIDEVSA